MVLLSFGIVVKCDLFGTLIWESAVSCNEKK